MSIKEVRLLDVEYRAEEKDGKMIIEGYPVTFSTPATHYGYTEIIEPNAFEGCDMGDVVMRYNHNDNYLIMARTRNRSLQLEVDNFGVKSTAELIDTGPNRDIYKSVQAGLIDKMSFAFTVEEDNFDYETDTRTIKKISKLYDVSVVDVPYYDSTSVYARKLDNFADYKKVIESEKRKRLAKELAMEELRALL